ncbi:SDR family NAD(P)-dependent oxidoreductase [Micromonospora sp. LOL_014]|uniref:SDR family NAD(P)-dependent oxidoreductase n=1 Tax=Micromonospora sp. LOL_014 TaxID=3345415 RepID=UPI003A838633
MFDNDGTDPTQLIAVVGMAGRFPQAPDVDSFWRLLRDRSDAIAPVPGDRWDASAQLDPERHVQDVGGFVDEVDLFDPGFFGISPREAEDIDPQQRLMLETVWRTLEDAGQPAAGLRGSRTGVYVGASWHDYEILRKERGLGATTHSAVGNALDVIAARVSYFLRLTGPSLVVETGCSSSLVALHLAGQALRAGETDAALVGGVNLILAPDVSIGLTAFGGLSPEGRCKAFSATADGFVRAECVSALMLKRLDRAIADGDRIRGVIVRTVVNNDGGGESLVTPNPAGQEDLLRRAYQGLDGVVDRLRYVEAHGTGTGRGDPIEAGAIGRVLGRAGARAGTGSRDGDGGQVGAPLAIGSVKTNIGHAEAAAGLAGLVKVLLALEHRVVPPSLHSTELNPAIDFTGLNLRLVREPLPLPVDEAVCLGVNSFGWGGTNAHVVVADPPAGTNRRPAPATAATGPGVPAVLPVSAHTNQALTQRLRDLRDRLAAGAEPQRLAGALAHRRDHFPLRTAVVAADAESAVALIDAHLDDPQADLAGITAGRADTACRTAFVFPGQGAQWAAMGQRLYAEVPTFAKVIDRCADALRPYVDWDLTQVVSGAAGDGWLSQVDMLQPTLWAASVGLAELWRATGVVPDVVVGHSQGEVAAATVAGILSYSDAAMVVARRSALALRTSGNGRMLAVSLDREAALDALAGFEELVSLAVHNGPSSCVLSGETEAVLTLKELLDADEVFCRLVDVDYASHSPQMDALTDDLLAALHELRPGQGEVELMSTVRVAPLAGPEMDARYWVDNLRQPVQFHDTMGRLFDDGVTHVVEISPHPVLVPALEQLAAARPEPPRVLSTLRRDQGTPADLAAAFGRSYVAGLAPFAGLPDGFGVDLPGYPWQRSTHWPPAARRRSRTAGTEITLVPSPSETDLWQAELELGIDDQPWLDDHRVHDAVVVPGAAMIVLGLGAGRARTGRLPASLHRTTFHSNSTLADGPARLGLLWRDDVTEGGSFVLQSLGSDGTSWFRHATAQVRHATGAAGPVEFPGQRLADPATEVDPETFYAGCHQRGLRYGPAFQGIRRLRHGADWALAELALPARCRAGAAAYPLHPALLDAALQVSLALHAGPATVVPTGVDRIDVHGELAEPTVAAWSYVFRHDDGRYDVHLYDADRTPLLSLHRLTLQELDVSGPADPDGGLLHQLRFLPRPVQQPGAPDGRWLIVGSGDTAAGTTPGDSPAAGLVADIAAELRRVGAEVGVPSADDVDAVRDGDLTGLVYLAPPASAGLDRQRQALVGLADLVRACLTRPAPPRLVLVTVDAQTATATDQPDPGAALFWGFARVLRREHPELAATVIDLPGTAGTAGSAGTQPTDTAAALVAELGAADGDDQVVLRPDGRYVGRILATGRANLDGVAVGTRPRWRTPRQPFRLIPARAGGWDGLEFRPLRRRRPGPGEVEVEVTAAALNFIDVMKAVGTYPDPVGAGLLGGECAGRVTAVGAGVTGLAVGNRVVACVFGALASHVTVNIGRVRLIPPELSDEDAAALPLVGVTAWYGLAELGRTGPGDAVLVHSAAGGLGLAAIAVARHLGAEVIATAGTESKREHLRRLGIRHVFDSRDLSWAEQVLTATDGRGCDVILNSLTGAALTRGLDVLAEDGRFIEVGKMDIYADRTISLSAFRKGISLASVDVAGLMQRRPARFSEQFGQVWELVRTGQLGRLPVIDYPFDQAAEALREMSQGRHIGKFVLSRPDSVASVAPEPLPDGRFRDDGTYLITGGLGALGLSLAEFVAAAGGGAIALLGRSAPDADAAARIDAVRHGGVQVRTYQVDVADQTALADVLAQVRADLPPLRGVVHAAGVLDDATIATLHSGQLDRVVAPKVDGARHLNALTGTDSLDLFVLFSSAAALVGNAGQAAYAAANAYLDGLAEYRRRRGLAALSVQWGPFAGVGLAARDGNRGDRLAERGMGSFPAEQAWPALTRLLTTDATVVGYLPLNLRQWFDAYPDTAALPSWQELRAGRAAAVAGGDGGQFLDQLRNTPADDRAPLVEAKVRELTGRVLRIDPTVIDRDTPFKALGLDSLMSLELRNRLEAAFDLKLSPTLLWTYGTSGALTGMLCDRLPAGDDERPVPAPDAVPATE